MTRLLPLLFLSPFVFAENKLFEKAAECSVLPDNKQLVVKSSTKSLKKEWEELTANVTPNARNIFTEYEDPDCIYMLNEGAHCERSLEKSLIEQQLGEVDWPIVNGQPDYYNVGVMLLSQSHQLFSYCDLPLLQSVCNHIRFYEQTVFNYQIFKHQLKHTAISASFNRMDMFGEEGYLDADFIHYTGKGYAKNNRRRDVQFLKDFAQLYAGIVREEDIKRLKAQAWQQYLNKIYKKYPLPNFLLKVLCECNVPHWST